jgi:hypothetical protein
MARVRLEFDTDRTGDGELFIDGERVNKIRYISLISGYDFPSKLLVTHLPEDEDGKPFIVKDKKGESNVFETTFEVFEHLKIKDRELEKANIVETGYQIDSEGRKIKTYEYAEKLAE